MRDVAFGVGVTTRYTRSPCSIHGLIDNLADFKFRDLPLMQHPLMQHEQTMDHTSQKLRCRGQLPVNRASFRTPVTFP
jgi:hypothetical protein